MADEIPNWIQVVRKQVRGIGVLGSDTTGAVLRWAGVVLVIWFVLCVISGALSPVSISLGAAGAIGSFLGRSP